jgi:opacity protein-like surface antigen
MEAVLNRLMCQRCRAYAPPLVLLVLVVLMIPGPAAAQAPAGASASAAAADEPLPRWDTTGFLGWRGTRRVEPTEYNTNRWDARFVYGGTVGYYWTTNLKLEADVAGTSPSRYDTYEPHQVAGATYPFFIRSDHRIVTASVGGSVIYQFFENASFHPFVGAGAAGVAIRERINTPRQSQVVSRGPNVPSDVVVISEAQSRQDNRSEARGLIVTGFKAYPNERLFFRSDVQWSIGKGRLHEVTWRLGVGVDF